MTRIETLIKNFPANADAALITSGENRFYFSNFRSSAGVILVTRDIAYLIVDFRYGEAAQISAKNCKVIVYDNFSETICNLVKKHNLHNVLIERDNMTISELKTYENILKNTACNIIVNSALDNIIKDMRIIKSEQEIEKIKASQEITEKAFYHILDYIKVGVKERDLALEIEYFMKKCGAENVAFDLIVISGKKTSLPHGVPSNDEIKNGDFVLMDTGALLDGYHSDMTRTVAINGVSQEQIDIYNIVLKANTEAIKSIRPGIYAKDVDKIARDIIYNAGYEGCFGHSTGHGVGLQIHEYPVASPKSKNILEKNMIFTVEPGIYLPNKFGVRIEDMVAVTENGAEILTSVSKELIII